MSIELKEIILHIRKGVMFSIRISYKSARAHPYISGLLFLLLILHRAFPSLFGFLVSSSPVIVCTAILLGTLLSYGSPNVPEIEEEDKKTQEISSLKTTSVVDDVVLKRNESCTMLTHLETDMKTNERAVEVAVGEASNSASNEVERDVPSAQIHDEGNLMNNTVLTTSLLLEENKQEIRGELKEESEVMDYGFFEKREFSIGNQAELAVEDADVHNVAVNDQNELEGLRIQIAKPASDSPFDSSLGSPWKPVNTFDASSDSDSDGAESSSPDASMADIIPMLDELHPLLDSVHPQPTLRAFDNSDAASSGLSQDSESESGTAEHEVENKENAESEEKEDTNDVLVPWTTDDQKNVMDLGYIEAERNRRLENLIARRRLRKLQRFETQKNLIDIDSFYPSSIPPISAPRQNPFDVPHDFGGPGSAPSAMQPRQNPFDLPCDQVGEVCILSREYLSHHDFISAAQREMASQRLESSTAGPSFSGDSNQEKKGLKLKSRFVAEGIDSEETGAMTFERQFASQKDHQELIKPEINQESTKLSPISNDVEQVQQDRQSFETTHFVENKHEWSLMDVDTDCATDFNTSVNIEETNLAANDFRVMEEEIGVVEDNLPVSDTGKLEVLEERYENSDSSSSSAESKKISRVHIHVESAYPEMSRDEPIQSELVDVAQAADLLCDSGPSAIGKSHPYISKHDETLLYEGLENFIASPLPSDLQVDLSEVASPPRPFEASLPLEDNSVDVDKSDQFERNDMINKPASVDKSAVPLSPKVGKEESLVRSFDLPSISEEILENFNPEVQHKNVMHPSASYGLTASQVVEESNVCMFDIEQEPSISQKATEEIGDNDIVIRLAPEGKDGDASGGSLIPTPDGDFPGSQFHELTGSMEFSTRLEMESEHDMGFSSDSSDVQSKCTNEILSKKEEGFLIDLNNSGEESDDDDVHAEVSGINDIDESLLSEIEAVGDYRVERELKSDQGDSNPQLGQLNCSVEGSDNEMQHLPNRLQDSSLLPFGEDPEMTVCNSKLHVLEVCSVDELDSIFKQHNHEEAEVLPASDLTLENSVTSQTEEGDRELGIANRDQEPTGTDTELLVLEAKSVEDISSALKKHSEGLNEPSTSEAETVEVLPERARLEPEETNSELHVIEAKSLDNTNLALKPLSEVTIMSPPEQLLEDGHSEVADVQSSEASASERHLEPENVEIQSAEEINLDSVTEQSSGTEHGSAAAADVSSSNIKEDSEEEI